MSQHAPASYLNERNGAAAAAPVTGSRNTGGFYSTASRSSAGCREHLLQHALICSRMVIGGVRKGDKNKSGKNEHLAGCAAANLGEVEVDGFRI